MSPLAPQENQPMPIEQWPKEALPFVTPYSSADFPKNKIRLVSVPKDERTIGGLSKNGGIIAYEKKSSRALASWGNPDYIQDKQDATRWEVVYDDKGRIIAERIVGGVPYGQFGGEATVVYVYKYWQNGTRRRTDQYSKYNAYNIVRETGRRWSEKCDGVDEKGLPYWNQDRFFDSR